MRSVARTDSWHPPVLRVAAAQATGLDALREAVDAHRAHLGDAGLAGKRRKQEKHWVESALRERFGSEGFSALLSHMPTIVGGPFARIDAAVSLLRERLLHSDTAQAVSRVRMPQA